MAFDVHPKPFMSLTNGGHRMADVVSLAEVRQRREAEEHARALVLFECAAALARQSHPGLLRVIEEAYGTDWIAARVRETLTPRRQTDAPVHARTRRSPK